MLPRLITSLVGWAVGIFYDVARSGPRVSKGPVLVTANHPNALVDPLVIFRTAGRPTRPLAKAPLFEHPVIGSVLKGLGGLPVYRRQDDASLMHLNDRTFDAAIEALQAGGAVQIYPEGQSHSAPSMTPLRTGAARIALMAEARSDWRLGLEIQPVGLTYTRKHLFRGLVAAEYGEAFPVADFREAFERDERTAVRDLTALIQERMERVTLNFDHPDDRELVDVAERLYASQKRLARPRERPPMVERLPRLRRFAEGVRWLRASDPDRLDEIVSAVRRYLRLLTLFGASEGDVPSRYRLGPVLRYSVWQVLMLTLVLPVAAAGIVAWFVPFLFTSRGQQVLPALPADQIATYKISVGALAFSVWYVAVASVVFSTLGVQATAIVLAGMPVAGLAAIAWRDRQATVREDLRVFLRARRRSQTRDRLREQRAYLVREFDALTEAWNEDRQRRRTMREP